MKRPRREPRSGCCYYNCDHCYCYCGYCNCCINFNFYCNFNSYFNSYFYCYIDRCCRR